MKGVSERASVLEPLLEHPFYGGKQQVNYKMRLHPHKSLRLSYTSCTLRPPEVRTRG